MKKLILSIITLSFTLSLSSCSDPSAGSGVPVFFSDVETVSAGSAHTVAIRKDGTLWAWGNNSYGQLGDGTKIESNVPVQVGNENDWIAVSAGNSYTMAIKKDGSLWAWGNNFYGQLGLGDTTARTVPERVGTGQWESVSAGPGSFSRTMAIKKDGTLWAWGFWYLGNGGTGGGSSSNVPVAVTDTAPSIPWTAVSTGESHTVAIKSNGTLWAWGLNSSGQLGNGGTSLINTPVPVTDPDPSIPWIAVSAGSNHTVAIKSNGTLWVWGANNYGELGNDTIASSNIPIRIDIEGGRWKDASAGSAYINGSHTVAIKEDGIMWAWGNNYYGQLGNGERTSSSAIKVLPVKVIGVGNRWKTVSAGASYTVAIKEDGVLWSWGRNSSGQLGDATMTDRAFPKRVILSGW